MKHTHECEHCGHEHECEMGDSKDSKDTGKQDLVGAFPDGANSGHGPGLKLMAGKMAKMMKAKK